MLVVRAEDLLESRATVRKFAPLIPLPLLLALAAWGSARAADAVAVSLGAALGAVASVVGTEQRPSEDDAVDAAIPTSVVVTGVDFSATETGALAAPKKGKTRSGSATATEVRSIYVSAAQVLKLADARVRPRGVRVPADGKRPAGLKLLGVAGLGIGLRDGDVLTRAIGQPALASSAVVRAILVARSKRVKVLEGEFYRGQERWTIRVEQPYLDEASGGLTAGTPGPRLPAP
jgi:hypothetical protein